MSYTGNLNGNETIDYSEWACKELKMIFDNVDGVDVSEILHPLRRLMTYADGVGFDIYDMMEKKGNENYHDDFDMDLICGTENILNRKIEIIDYTSCIKRELSFALDYAIVGNVSEMVSVLRSLKRYTESLGLDVSPKINEIENIGHMIDEGLFDALVHVIDDNSDPIVSLLTRVERYVGKISADVSKEMDVPGKITVIQNVGCGYKPIVNA